MFRIKNDVKPREKSEILDRSEVRKTTKSPNFRSAPPLAETVEKQGLAPSDIESSLDIVVESGDGPSFPTDFSREFFVFRKPASKSQKFTTYKLQLHHMFLFRMNNLAFQMPQPCIASTAKKSVPVMLRFFEFVCVNSCLSCFVG
jgi:hypothetical protein